MRPMAVTLMVISMLLASCGQDPVAGPVEDDRVPGDDQAPEATEGADLLEGTLGGDPRLEGGCAWLDTDDGRFEVLYPPGYEIMFEPVRLVDADGDTLAEEGETVRVRGRVAKDRMSICQVGAIFEASEVVTE